MEKKKMSIWIKILIVIAAAPVVLLIAEVVALVIKIVAPGSPPAIFIDGILNWIILLFTG